ncbi:hypothetical protein MTR67_015694 [Solanum verrucosum]|uniref:Uncharacterized protein n=1 Tax=Solanum verrucosum TaxID=315347 RepID=A0AAF0QLX9_SOLVR|nr:hypothetical protein MTR67_002083 [Solanum verrucosum]WMV22309.1 hypothetical protein MTR67_015694 [Solanum verrucosum]
MKSRNNHCFNSFSSSEESVIVNNLPLLPLLLVPPAIPLHLRNRFCQRLSPTKSHHLPPPTSFSLFVDVICHL